MVINPMIITATDPSITMTASAQVLGISVSPVYYDFGYVYTNETYNTTLDYFTLLNSSPLETDHTIGVATSNWTGGLGWYHNDTCTPANVTAGMKANRGLGGSGETTNLTKNATSNSGTNWTDPTYAYLNNTDETYQITGNGTQTYSGYGFDLGTVAINQVMVRTDAWCIGIETNQSKNATANENGSKAWISPAFGYSSDDQYATASPNYSASSSKQPTVNSAGSYTQWTNPANAYDGGSNQYATATDYTGTGSNSTRRPIGVNSNTIGATYTHVGLWQDVDEEPSYNDTDYAQLVTNGGGRLSYNLTDFSIPVGSTVINLTVYYRAGNLASLANNVRAEVKTGTTFWDTIDAGVDPIDSPNFQTYKYAFTTNPSTGTNWTYDEINRTDSNTSQRLEAFGVSSTDCNPDVKVSWCYAEVFYGGTGSGQFDQVYNTFGFTDPESTSTVISVEIGYEGYCNISGKTANFYTSANGGSSWSSVHTSSSWGTSDPGSYTYINVTSDQSWTWTLLNNSNFKIKIETSTPTNNCIRYLDNLVVRVTYDGPTAFDQIYKTFGITDVGTLSLVEVGYEANATSTGKLDIYTSENGGSSWHVLHTTDSLSSTDPDSYSYINVTSDTSWTWTLLNDTNFKVKVVTNYTSGTPSWSLDSLVVRITYISATDDKIKIAVTWDGGASWSGNYETVVGGTETTYWTNVTSATAWTSTKLNDSNFQVRVSSVSVGDNSTIYLDYIPVFVEYTPPGIGGWGTGDVIVKYDLPDYIYENCPADEDYTFGLMLYTPKSFSDEAEKSIVVSITAVAS